MNNLTASSGTLRAMQSGPEIPARSGYEGVVLRICAGLSLLVILVAWFDVSNIVRELSSIDARFVLLAIGFFVLQLVLSCARWVYILGRQHVAIGSRNALSIYGVGMLANLFLVTSIAGMSARAALMLRAGAGVPESLASLTAERIAALAGLGICSVAGFVFAFPELHQFIVQFMGERPHLPSSGFAIAGTAILLSAAFLMFRRIKGLRVFFLSVGKSFSSLRQSMLLIGLSVGIILTGFAGMAALASGMGLSISLVFFVSVMPVIAFISALPISIGGWGVREGVMVAGLSIFSVPADSAMALSISYGLGGLLVALLLGAALAFMGGTARR